MSKLDHPFIVKMHRAFQSDMKLYFVLDFLNGGELYFHLKKEGKFTENKARFYASEVILAVEHLHLKGIVYRDLKPENILLDEEGHIKLTDFGLSKTGMAGDTKSYSFCGTPEYLAPEIVSGKGHSKNVDWWSLGLLLYEMLSGSHPFKSKRKNRQEIFSQITDKPVEMLPGFSEDAADIISKLLAISEDDRLGNSDTDAAEIKNHKFFEKVDWEKLEKKEITPPYKPCLDNSTDLRNIDQSFTMMSADDNNGERFTTEVGKGFEGFSFRNSDVSSKES